MKSRRAIRFAAAVTAVSAMACFSGGLAGSAAMAQVSGFYESDNPYVSVDLSVLGDGGSSTPSSRFFAPGFSGSLLLPGTTQPLSQLHVAPQSGAGSLPPPAKGRVAVMSADEPSLPPDKPPVSTVNVPGVEIPAPEKTETVPAKAPPEPTPAPAVLAAAPQPPAEASARPAESAPPAAAESTGTGESTPPPPPAVAAPEPAPPASGTTGSSTTAAAGAKQEAPQQAALPPAGSKVEPGSSVRVVFDASASKLPDDSLEGLKGLVASVVDESNLRLQLLAYAGGESLSSSKARRLSLSRALAVRSFLIENGLRSTRIDVRALGNKTDDDPVNRVDINVIER